MTTTTIENGLRVVEIAENSGEWIACYFIHGTAVRSRTFKTLGGATKWARTQVAG